MDKRIIMPVPELLIEVIVTGIMATTIGSVVKPVNLFVKEKAGQFLEELLHIHPISYSMLHNIEYVYLMHNVCIYSMEVVHQNNNFCELLNNSLPIIRNVKKCWLCVKNVNKSLFYVGPIIKAISCLPIVNVLLSNYSRDTSDDITKELRML